MRLAFLGTCRQAAITLMAASAFGQAPGTITTVAGNGNFGNSGDGGLATKPRPMASQPVSSRF